MIGANELYGVVRMTGVGIAIGESWRVAISSMRLRVAVMMNMIVRENDADAVVPVRHAYGMFAIRHREQNSDARNDVVPGAEKSQEAQARGEATEPLRRLCSGLHRRRNLGVNARWVNVPSSTSGFVASLRSRFPMLKWQSCHT